MCSDMGTSDCVRPGLRQRLFLRTPHWDAMRLPVLIGVCSLCVFGWGIYRFGSIRMTLAYVSGSVIAPVTPEIDLGEVRFGEAMTAEFRVRNLSSHPVTILGANSDCGCICTGVVSVFTMHNPREILHFVQNDNCFR